MRLNNNHQAFMALVRAGLWEKDVQLLPYGELDFNAIYKLAQEQSVVGLLAAGLEHVKDVKVPQALALIIAGEVLQLEQRNRAMNEFVADMVEKMREAGIYTLVIKGQGVAQCYEKPLWRSCGDVDFLLSLDNYNLAKSFLIPLAESVNPESGKHQGMTIGPWIVELHGNLHCGLSTQMDRAIDDIQKEVFFGGNVRSWINGSTYVFLPDANNDILFIFTHFLKHFYRGGLGLRQICDWCRLLWTYRETIDIQLLKRRLHKMRLITEWKAFGVFAVEYLGMPSNVMPLYENKFKWRRKAKRINAFIMFVGNMGHNRDSKYKQYPFVLKKFFAMTRRLGDLLNHALIFPMDSIRFFPRIMINGIHAAAKGIG